MDLLQAARLSRLGDAATGLDKQDEAANRYASVHGHAIVATAADTDVSGSTDPWERPKLGPWLQEGTGFDGIVAATLDRLGRNARHLSKLRDWAEDSGKKIIVVSPPLMWPPEPDDLASPIIWDVLARLAEYELAAITKRARETQAWLKANGFLVGKPPFGYMVTAKGDHKTLAPVPEMVPIVCEMFDRYLSGETLTGICQWLDESDVKPSRAVIWNPRTVSAILRNTVYVGRRVDRAGKTVLKVQGIIEPAVFRQVRHKLDNAPTRRGATAPNAAMLAGTLFCHWCNGPMYRMNSRGKFWYRCHGTARQPSTCRNMIPVDDMDAWVSREMSRLNQPVIKRDIIPGSDHADEVAEVERDIDELDLDAGDAIERFTALRAERARLLALPTEPDRVVEQETGETIAQLWARLDGPERRAALLQDGVRVTAYRQDGEIVADLSTASVAYLAAEQGFGEW